MAYKRLKMLAGINRGLFDLSGGFLPSDVDNLALWLEADSGVFEATDDPAEDGDSVLEWHDQSSNGNNATIGVAGDEPVYRTSQINSLPALDFNIAADTRLELDSTIVTTTFHIFIVNRLDSLVAFQFLLSNDAASTPAAFAVRQTNRMWTVDDSSTSDTNLITGGDHATATWYLWEFAYDAATGTIYRNATSIRTESRSGHTFTWGRIGNDPSEADPCEGDIAAVLIYSSVLSAGDLTSIRTYLNDKYAIY